MTDQIKDSEVNTKPYLPNLSVRAIREMRGYTIDNVAVTSGLTWQEIADVEEGRLNDIRLLRRIATALRIPLDALPETEGARRN